MLYVFHNERVLYGSYGTCFIWTAKIMFYMVHIKHVLYGPYKTCSIWTIQNMFYMVHIEHFLYGPYRTCSIWTKFHVMQGSMVPRRRGKGARAPRGIRGALPPGREVWGSLRPSQGSRGVWGAARPPMFDSENIKI